MTDDADAEQVFIDYLVEENDSYSALRRIARIISETDRRKGL